MKQCSNPLHYFPKHQIAKIVLMLLPVCLLTLSFLSGCKKNTTELPPYTSTTSTTWTKPSCDTCLPPITNEGKNTFGCKINGKNWTTKDDPSTIGIRIDIWQNTLNIIAKNAKTIDGLTININPILDTTLFVFPTSELTLIRGKYSKDYITKFDVEPLSSGFIHLTRVDYLRGIFSGTFAFDLYNNEGDTMHITEGRFDVRK